MSKEWGWSMSDSRTGYLREPDLRWENVTAGHLWPQGVKPQGEAGEFLTTPIPKEFMGIYKVAFTWRFKENLSFMVWGKTSDRFFLLSWRMIPFFEHGWLLRSQGRV